MARDCGSDIITFKRLVVGFVWVMEMSRTRCTATISESLSLFYSGGDRRSSRVVRIQCSANTVSIYTSDSFDNSFVTCCSTCQLFIINPLLMCITTRDPQRRIFCELSNDIIWLTAPENVDLHSMKVQHLADFPVLRKTYVLICPTTRENCFHLWLRCASVTLACGRLRLSFRTTCNQYIGIPLFKRLHPRLAQHRRSVGRGQFILPASEVELDSTCLQRYLIRVD